MDTACTLYPSSANFAHIDSTVALYIKIGLSRFIWVTQHLPMFNVMLANLPSVDIAQN